MKKISGINNNRGIEENTLAILDPSGVKDSRDVEDDRLTFLEAVRAASLVPENGIVPTSKMFSAIFCILKDATSLELIMESFQLLNELDKVWSPFSLGIESSCSNKEVTYRNSGDPLDPYPLADMLLFQFLVDILEGDFSPRNTVYKDTMNWDLLKESFLNLLLGSRRISFKGLMKECLAIISPDLEETERPSNDYCDFSLSSATLKEIEKRTYMAVNKLLTLIIELDMSKKQADMQGFTARAYGVRDEYDVRNEIRGKRNLPWCVWDDLTLSALSIVFSDPKWKLEIVLQYFWKYLTKPSVRTRRCNSSSEDATFDDVLRSFSNDKSTKSLVKSISTEVAQVLLAHGLQAYLSLQHHVDGNTTSSEGVRGGSVVQICKNVISAFQSLGRIDKNMEMIPFGRQAVFTAATILSTKS
ncbi:hypothetical protein GIB67_039289 [Kingdonia uniflora]|uniref:Uncharacterized protein n=1 Tax=Kingdonia uniflora TaxID=39325 RepID=A0A7J7MML3_9MAGN|nr:hypothetical protein GIB67_039289 [Kingdonia uniflora]